jgi:hypothetical protein
MKLAQTFFWKKRQERNTFARPGPNWTGKARAAGKKLNDGKFKITKI